MAEFFPYSPCVVVKTKCGGNRLGESSVQTYAGRTLLPLSVSCASETPPVNSLASAFKLRRLLMVISQVFFLPPPGAFS